MAYTGYCSMLDKLVKASINYETDTFKILLTTSGYSPNQDTHDFRDDIGANEVAGGGSTGYTAGGVTVDLSTSLDVGNNRLVVTIPQGQWTTGAGGTLTARTAVLYKSRGGASSADELIAYSSEAGDQTASNGGTFTVAAGSITLQL